MLSAFSNIFKIPELRRKIYFTLLIIAIYRLGSFIPVPGIDVEALQRLFENLSKGDNKLAGSLVAIGNLFTGGAISNAAIFGLGVMPYISSSIIFQVLTVVWPSLQALSKEGESGRKKIQQYVRITTVFLSFFQAMIICIGLSQYSGETALVLTKSVTSFVILGSLIITTGCMLLMWLGEQIDEYGIGNGISMIIMIGIVGRFFPGIMFLAGSTSITSIAGGEGTFGIVQILLMIVLFAVMIVVTVLITRGQRRIPIQQARRTRGTRVYGGQRTYLPIGVNMVNVIPIIFAQALFIIPQAFASMHETAASGSFLWYATYIFTFLNYGTFWYTVFYVGLIVFFSYFYAAITFKPDEVADRMKQYGNFIPGIRPGKQTEQYLENILTHVTMFGSLCLAGIAIMPMVASAAFDTSYLVTGFFGGTGLLIAVGVALDLMSKVESHLLMHNYEGFLKKGRIKGRRG